DASHVVDILQLAGWKKVTAVGVAAGANEAQVATLMASAYGVPTGNTDFKLFYYSGHGSEFANDVAPVDETGANGYTADNQYETIEIIIPTENFPSWPPYGGNKLIVYDSCHAGGMWDGTADPVPADAYIFGAADRRQKSESGEQSSTFTGVFVEAFLQSGA